MAMDVLDALRAMRPPFAMHETDLHRLIGAQLEACGLFGRHEALLAPGSRIDYLVGDVGIEIKNGKPNPTTLKAQLTRYAGSELIGCLIVVSWRSVRIPEAIRGKPVYPLVLSQLWGVSLP